MEGVLNGLMRAITDTCRAVSRNTLVVLPLLNPNNDYMRCDARDHSPSVSALLHSGFAETLSKLHLF